MGINLNRAEFVRSAVSVSDFLYDNLPQIVFAGKSNVGKSSVINRLLNRKNFARVGASPGKTTHINFFAIDETMYFVDLPGYGYAKVSQKERERWGRLIDDFLNWDKPVSLGVFIVDIRHKPTQNDVVMADFFKELSIPFIIVANKSDKLKKSQIEPAVELISETLDVAKEIVVPFSAEKGDGRETVLERIYAAINFGG